MPINSKAKGKRNELAWVHLLKAAGYPSARRGQQFKGTEDSPDIICPELDMIHFECKSGSRIDIWKTLKQAHNDKAQEELAVVAAHKDREPWIVCMTAEDWFKIINKAFLALGVLTPFAS